MQEHSEVEQGAYYNDPIEWEPRGCMTITSQHMAETMIGGTDSPRAFPGPNGLWDWVAFDVVPVSSTVCTKGSRFPYILLTAQEVWLFTLLP